MDNTGKRIVLILALILTVFIAATYFRQAMHTEYQSSYELPMVIGSWQGMNLDANLDFLRSELGSQDIVFRTYSNNNVTITLYLAYYKDVDSANKVHAPTVCYPGQGWTVVHDDIIAHEIDGRKVYINRLIIQKEKEREIVYNWWQTGDAIFPRNSTNRFYQMFRSIIGRNPSSVWVRLSVNSKGDAVMIEKDLVLLTRNIIPLIGNYFHRTISLQSKKMD